MTFRRICILVCALALIGCAEEKKPGVQADGKIEGTLTINGERHSLKCVYVGRNKEEEEVEMLLTDEPVSHETLSEILLTMGSTKKSETLRDSRLTMLYFAVDEYDLRPTAEARSDVSYKDFILITSESFFDPRGYSGASGSGDVFNSFGFNDGTLKVGSTGSFESTAYETTGDYSFTFEVKLKDESLLSRSLSSENKGWQIVQSRLPEEGKAEGELDDGEEAIKLNYAYAMRDKYDGDDVITVLLTAEPIPQKSLLFEFKRIRLNSIQGLYIGIDRLGKLRWRAIKDSSGCSFEDPDATAEWIDGLKEFEVKNGRIIGRLNETDVEDAIAPVRYSVSFNSPVKD